LKNGLVIVCRREEAIRRLPELCSEAGFQVKEHRLALVKPNICGMYHPSMGLLSSVIHYLEPYASEIVVGETESMMHTPRDQFERLGVMDVLEPHRGKAKALDLSESRRIRVPVPNPHALAELELPEMVLKSDVLVNLPKVGTHSTTRLTNALKNLFGLLPQKRKYSMYHPLGMDEVIADISQLVKTDLNVVDAEEKVIVGTNALHVDIAACRLVNLDPLEVRHLRLVSEDQGEELEETVRKLQIVEI